MAKIHQVKNTIRSTQKTAKITHAMHLVSAAKLGKAQKRMADGKPYAKTMLSVIQTMADAHCEYRHPFMFPKTQNVTDILVVSSNRGLCGGLNTALFKTILNQAQAWQSEGKTMAYGLYGRKAIQFFGRLCVDVVTTTVLQEDEISKVSMLGTLKEAMRRFLDGETAAVWLAYNEFHSVMVQKPVLLQLLPLPKLEQSSRKHQWDYVYEPDAKTILDVMLERYIESEVYQAIVENYACEQASRMLAMKNATENANGIIQDLKLMYNKARQAAITQEISEIVAGAQGASDLV